jgi:carbon monoxide dehydrogenase subunit G
MEMTGQRLMTAPRERVWAALNDPEVLRRSIPGCEELEKTSDSSFAAKVVARIGPVKAKFGGKVSLSDLDPPNGYTLTGEGSGGAAGFAKGRAVVCLVEEGQGTRLAYTVKADVGGKLAQIGSRLIESSAKKMADDFFDRFVEIVEEPDTAPELPDPSLERAQERLLSSAATSPGVAAQTFCGNPRWAAVAGVGLFVAGFLVGHFG